MRVGGGGVLRAHRDICSAGPAVCAVAIEGNFRTMKRQCVLVRFAGGLGGNIDTVYVVYLLEAFSPRAWPLRPTRVVAAAAAEAEL